MDPIPKTNLNTAFITGITGQDGYYLTEYLLSIGYTVHGMIRRTSQLNHRLDPFYVDTHNKTNLYLHYGDMTDAGRIMELILDIKPTEVYNLAAMSHVKISFDTPADTTQINANGTLNLLNACRKVPNVRFYQASTSEMFGGSDKPLNENSPFNPKSPYAVAKLYAHYITKNYRESYNMFCCSGILFNHTSIMRGHNFVEQKIVKGAVAIRRSWNTHLYLGNIYSKRDIGHSRDYVKAMHSMLQQDHPVDYVIATGETYTIKELVEKVFWRVFSEEVSWEGTGFDEKGYVGNTHMISIDKRYFRPCEVDVLIGDSSKAQDKLKWKPNRTIDRIIQEMVEFEMIPSEPC